MILHPDQMATVVLAGGLGTRIRHLFPDLPKPMVPVRGRPFLDWVVGYLQRQGIRHVWVSTGHLGEVIEHYFAGQPVEGVTVNCAREPEALGTAGGFLNAVETSRQKPAVWLVLNGDSLVLADLALAAEPLCRPDVQGVVVGVAVSDASRYGRIAFNDSLDLVRFEEKQPGAGVINAGIYLFKASLLALFPVKCPLSFERDVFPSLLEGGARVRVCVSRAPFLDIGTPEALALAGTFIAQNFPPLLPA